MGHRVAVLRDGRLQQCDTPRALYDRPTNTFVAGFIGSPAMNLCRVPVGDDGVAELDGVRVALPPGVATRPERGGAGSPAGVARAGAFRRRVLRASRRGRGTRRRCLCVLRGRAARRRAARGRAHRLAPPAGARRERDVAAAHRRGSRLRRRHGGAARMRRGLAHSGDAADAARPERAHGARGDPRAAAGLARRDLAAGRHLEADCLAGAAFAARGAARARGGRLRAALRRDFLRAGPGGGARPRNRRGRALPARCDLRPPRRGAGAPGHRDRRRGRARPARRGSRAQGPARRRLPSCRRAQSTARWWAYPAWFTRVAATCASPRTCPGSRGSRWRKSSRCGSAGYP